MKRNFQLLFEAEQRGWNEPLREAEMECLLDTNHYANIPFHYPTAQSRVQITREQYKYPEILDSYLDGSLFCIVKNLFSQSGARATRFYPLCFSRSIRNDGEERRNTKKSSWIINNLLDILKCSIAEKFYELCRVVKIRYNL